MKISLPDELFLHIFSYLESEFLFTNIQLVSKHCQQLTYDEKLCEESYQTNFGGPVNQYLLSNPQKFRWRQHLLSCCKIFRNSTETQRIEFLVRSKHFRKLDLLLTSLNIKQRIQAQPTDPFQDEVVNQYFPRFRFDEFRYIFHEIAEQGNSVMLKIFLKHLPDARLINVKNDQGRSPLHVATYFKQSESAKLLVAAGADLHAKELTYQQTSLDIACSRGLVDLVEFFLSKGMNINAQDVDGFTPLHIAIYAKKYDVVKVLVEKGADKTKVTKTGRTPKQMAIQMHAPQSIIDLL
jgi:hypothetical protein